MKGWKFTFFLCTLPLFYILFLQDGGIDPAKVLTHSTGNWAIIFLILSLSATPMLRLFKQKWLMQRRRQLGLWTFFYSLLHLLSYLVFLLPSLSTLLEDIVKRPYITVGFVAFLLLLALAITSTKGWQKRLKRNWMKLHKSVYVIAILVLVHWWMTLRSDITEWVLYAVPLLILLGWRVYNARKVS